MKKKKILLLPKYTKKGPSSRYRLYQYIPILSEKYSVEVSPFFSDNYISQLLKGYKPSIFSALFSFIKRALKVILLSARNTKLVLIEYELIPYFPSIFESILTWKGIRYVSIYDDAVFHRYDKSTNLFIKTFLSKKVKNVMKKSAAVIVGNKYLFEYAKTSTQSNIFLIPTVVNPDLYPPKKDFSDNIKVVWIGSPSTSKYLQKIEGILLRLSESHSFELDIIGARNVDLNKNIRHAQIDFDETNESSNLSDYDIGIMPLFNSEWELGKCGFKLIQYMASGLPTIADSVGANSEIIINGETGFLCNSDKEWLKNFEMLLTNKKLRQEFGSNGVKRVRKLYSLNSTKEIFLKIVHESIGGV